MPVLTPIGGGLVTQFLISDLAPEVLLKAENKTTDLNRAYTWLRDAILEISASPDYRDDFVELEEWGPIYNLVPMQQEYLEQAIIPPGQVITNACDILIWVDYPANTNRRKLDVSHYQKTDRFQPVNSLPTEWYRFSGFVGFNPVPDQAYQIQARVVQMHPFNDNNLGATPILLPRDWNEILIWAAVQRAFMEYMEYEKANKIHVMLFGDPDNKNQPGLIFHAKRKRRKEQWRMESRLTFIRRPAMWGA